MSDTPRSHATEKEVKGESLGFQIYRAWEFARQLERELAETHRIISLERETFARAIGSCRAEQRAADVALLTDCDPDEILGPRSAAIWLEKQSL